MATLADAQIAEAARKAGFTGPALTTAIAIALAESGGRVDAVGDTSLVDGKWGPSVGLWQIRSLHEQRGTGGPRDEFANIDPTRNASAAFEISGGGANFAPWSVFKNGRYQAFMGRAEQAAGRLSGTGGKGLATDRGPSTRLPGVSGIAGSVQRTVITAVIAAGGAALVVFGMWKGTR